MKRIKPSLLTLGLMGLFTLTFAGTSGEVSSAPMNNDGYFIGVGGSYNFGGLNSSITGTLNATGGFPPLGMFSGTIGTFNNTAQILAPEVQAGYFRYFRGNEWLLGLEFLYQYTNLKFRTDNPGFSVSLTSPAISVVNAIDIHSIETKVSNTLMVPAFVGRFYSNGFIYLGLGPSLFDTQQRVTSVDDSSSAFYIGTIGGFSKNDWVWGGAVQAGIAYYLSSSWFLRLNYTCAFTGDYIRNNSVAFSPERNNGLNSGVLSFIVKQGFVTQEVGLSINKLFAF